ncbi:MAG: MFS transporter [Bacteroidota bacterium]
MAKNIHNVRLTLPIIVLSQFFCTSLWFAGNSIISDLSKELNLDQHFLAHLTSAIQFGFITGTLFFAIFTLSDRFSPSKVFFFSSILAGIFNLGISLNNITSTEILLLRFSTGFFLAGIYPVGMKVASDYSQAGLGKSLGFLVGALAFGTALPHLLKNLIVNFPWKYVLYSTTILSFLGGLCILLFVPNGPYRKAAQKIKLTAFLDGFKKRDFRSVAFGYFGHMWELYTFWAFVPVMLLVYNNHYPETHFDISLFSFLIIASGGISCFVSGLLSQYFGVKKVAAISLLVSCLCCVLSPLFLLSNSPFLFITFLFIWGFTVIADSPLFSTLVAQNAPEESRGTSLTIVNCIGFSITIFSIQCINYFSDKINEQYIYIILAIGPILGLIALLKNKTTTAN